MNEQESLAVQCPYCGETMTVLVDCSIPQQSYVEGCQICCQPILFDVKIGQKEEITIAVRREDGLD